MFEKKTKTMKGRIFPHSKGFERLKPPHTVYSGQVGRRRVFEHFSGFRFFLFRR
jgi:hypothetical protein